MMNTVMNISQKKNISHLLCMEDMRMIGKTEKDCESYRLFESLVIIFIWKCGLKMCKYFIQKEN